MHNLVKSYLDGIAQVKEAVAGIGEPLLSFKPKDDAWSIKEIAIHLCDADLVAAYRMKKVIAEDNPLLMAFDQDAWTSRLGYSGLDHAFYLQLFGTIRSGMAEVLNNLPEEAWARTGIHNVAGKITLQDIVESYIGHVNDHVQQIERNKAAFAKGNR
jgi:hypothetical protein